MLTASTDQPSAAERQEADDLRDRPPVHLALHVRRELRVNAFGLPYSYQEMVVPANTTVMLDIQATDVIHSWWIPKLGGKFDAVPGYTNYTWFKAPDAPATLYTGQCAELCGRNHADMTARVRVVSPRRVRGLARRRRGRRSPTRTEQVVAAAQTAHAPTATCSAPTRATKEPEPIMATTAPH